MSGKHTPGPWIVLGKKGDGYDIMDGNMDPIASIKDDWADECEGEANANLITAAPELLTIAEAVLCQEKDGMDRSEWILQASRAAIAKAKGE